MADMNFINYRRALAGAAAIAALLLIGVGGYVFVRHIVEQGVQRAELKLEEERKTAEAEANRKAKEAAAKAEQDRQAKAAQEAEAKRQADAAEQQRRKAGEVAAIPNRPPIAQAPALPKAPDSAPAPSGAPTSPPVAQAPIRPAPSSPPIAQAPPAPIPPALAPKLSGSTSPPTPADSLPKFPWPPPAASASYLLPDNLLEGRRTIGEVVTAIISALEHNGYVERSFYQTAPGGVALVTRLERINDDGTSVLGTDRWSAGQVSSASLIQFLSGLFFVSAGHYRVIVFILQDLPFSQSSQTIREVEATTWLSSGFNFLPSSIANRPFAPDGHCSVLVYEFASDGKAVREITSGLTGKQHLEKAGVLSSLGNAN
jgi:hypothetical protein